MNKIEVRKHNNSTSITNNKYLTEVNCIGSEFFPDIGVEYNYLIWSDQLWINSYYADENNAVQEFSEKQLQKIEKICNEWIQPLGQEGNPTVQQAQEKVKLDLTVAFTSNVGALSNKTTSHEMSSWSVQIEEAKAIKNNESVSTPLIETLVVTRNLGETKTQLAEKIISKYNTYNVEYGKLLGKYQSLCKQVESATKVEDIEKITW